MSRCARSALYAACLFPALALAGNGFWSSTGPYGGLTYEIAFDPVTPTTLYAVARGGIFKSIDGGNTWARAENGLVSSAIWNFNPDPPGFLIDADDPQRLYALDASQRFNRSNDGGANWSLAGDNTPFDIAVTAMADVPGAGNVGSFYIAARRAFGGPLLTEGGIFKSTDGGVSFAPAGTGVPPSGGMDDVAVDPDNPDLVIAVLREADIPGADPSVPGIWRSTDAGATWNSVITFPGNGFWQISQDVAFGAGSTVYAVVGQGVTRSDDNGATWGPIAFANAETVAPHPTIANTVYVGGFRGFQVSTDGGQTFSASPDSLTPNASYTSTTPPNLPVPAFVRRIVLEPGFPAAGTAIWVATDGGGLFRSLDGGATFTSIAINDGLAAVNVRALAVHPGTQFTDATRPIYAGFGDPSFASGALFRSLNNGQTWPTANNGLKLAQVRGIALDPTTVGGAGMNPPSPPLVNAVVYATGRADRRPPQNSGLRNGGIFKSTNGGNSWTQIDAGLPRVGTPPNDVAEIGVVRGVILDPRSCANPPPGGEPCGTVAGLTTGQSPLGTVWAVANGNYGAPTFTGTHRVIRSTDGGATWAARDNGISLLTPDNQILAPIVLAMDPNDGNTLYVATGATVDGDPISSLPNPTIASGVFKTTDGGLNWSPVNNGRPFYPGSTTTAHDCFALAVHPSVSGTVWASRIEFDAENNVVSNGLQKTTDGGANWVDVGSGIPAGLDIRVIIVDRGNPDIVYVAGGGSPANPGAIYKSVDGGLSFRSISIGLPADSALSLAADPVDPRVIHAGTERGVWSLTQVPDTDGDGAPNNNESVAINPGGGPLGDGNNDGTPDALQGDVGSSIVLFAPEIEPLRLGRGTRALMSATPQGPTASFTIDVLGSTCTRANDVAGSVAADKGRDFINGTSGRAYEYPRDLVRFELPLCGAAQVDVFFPNVTAGGLPDFNDERWSFRIHGPSTPGVDATIGWHDLGARAQKINGTTWRLTLDANQFGSFRPVDNAILFQGGPAFNDDRVFGNGFE